MNRIVVGVDGSASSRSALGWAADEARRQRASLVVVHAWALPTFAYGTSLVPFVLPEHDGDAPRSARDLVEAMLSEVVLDGIPVDVRIVAGHAGEALVNAGRDAAMIVVGSRRRGMLGDLVLGSTLKHVTRHGDAPVVAIPHMNNDEDAAAA